MIRRIATVALVSVAALGLLPAGSASAAPPECPYTDTLCLFDGPNFTGNRFNVKAIPATGTCVDLVDHGWGGTRARSAINTNSRTATLHAIANCWGYPPVVVGGNSSVASFSISLSSAYVF